MIEARSRFARAFTGPPEVDPLEMLRVSLHARAGIIHPGSDNRQVLEIENRNVRPVVLFVGTPMVHTWFERVKDGRKHNGRHTKQKGV